MNRLATSQSQLLRRQTQLTNRVYKTCDVFINHRGIDTKRTVVTLLYDYLSQLNLRPFLDNKNMKPGDKLFDSINSAISQCKIGVTVFSPRYCESYFCLHELALITESKKKVIPIFYDINPSQLRVVDNEKCSPEETERFNRALEVAKCNAGLTFDSFKGNWSEVVKSASDIVIRSLMEMDRDGGTPAPVGACAPTRAGGIPCNRVVVAASPMLHLPGAPEKNEVDVEKVNFGFIWSPVHHPRSVMVASKSKFEERVVAAA